MTYNKKPSFIVPYKGQSWTKKPIGKGPNRPITKFHIDKLKQDIAEGANTGNALDKAGQLAQLATTPAEVIAVRIALGVIDNGLRSLANGSARSLPYYSQNSSSSIDDTKVHIIRFVVGRKSTKSVKAAESIHGSSNIQLRNSIAESQNAVTRERLTRSFGFNQKSIDFLHSNCYMVAEDYKGIYDLLNWNLPQYGVAVPYGLVMHEYCNIRIRNSNTYHKLTFRINIIKIIDDDVSMGSLYKKLINQNSTIQDYGALPVVYQIGDKQKVSEMNEDLSYCTFYNGVKLQQSTAFVTQAQIVKTFSRTIHPGDTLDFRMTHHMGPGIRLDLAKEYMVSGSQRGRQPSGYGLIVEAEGTPCQGMRIKDKAIFQGTCPGWYNYEYSKGVKLVRGNRLVSNLDAVDLPKLTSQYAIKIYERKYLQTPPITFSPNVIGEPGEEGKLFSILSKSKEHIVYGSSITDASNKKSSKEIENEFDQPYKNEIIDENEVEENNDDE